MSDETRTTDSDPELPALATSASQQAGSVLDDAGTVPDQTAMSLDERRDLADQFWLNALLTQVLHPSNSAHRESLIQRVMASLPAGTTADRQTVRPVADVSAKQTSRRSWIATAASLAVLLVLGAILLSPQAGPKTALAAVEQSLQAASEDVNRRYRIQMMNPDDIALPAITLTVRGANNFVWEQPVPRGTLRVGSNGQEFWMVPAFGPVMIAAEGSRLERLLSERQGSTPLLHLATALEWLRDRYDLELLDDEDVSPADSSTASIRCVHYRGRLRSRTELLLPETMEIWSARSSGVVQRMTLIWPALLKSGVHRADVLIQAPPQNLPAGWYEHAAHHAAQRLVIHPPKGKFTPPEDVLRPPP